MIKFRQIVDTAFGGIIFGAATFLLALPNSHKIQRLAMEKFHYTGDSFPVWAMLQLVPSMYNFENKSIIIWAALDNSERGESRFWPHHPFNDIGQTPADNALPAGLDSGSTMTPITRLISSYRGAELVTALEVKRSKRNGFIVLEKSYEFRHE